MMGTVAGCVALASRLHFDVPEKDRMPLEMALRSVLLEMVSEDCYRFLTGLWKWSEGKTSEMGLWVVATVADGTMVENEESIAEHIAENFQNESNGFWKQPYSDTSKN